MAQSDTEVQPERRPECFQTDVFGQRENDLFLAHEADSLGAQISSTLGFVNWTAAMTDFYLHPENWDDNPAPSIENALYDAGYEVEWNNGVYIYLLEDEDEGE